MTIQVKNVSYEIEQSLILDDISIVIPSGMTCIIGPNGAGKTTLLRILSGYLRPTKGSVLLDEQNISEMSIKTRAKKMALVPQNYAMEYDFSVLEIVLMGRNPHKKMFESDTPADIALARKCIQQAGISHLESRSVLGLSGGEWQRMIIARALCQQSDVLLLDEPVSNLDIKHQVGILDTVSDLVEEGKLLSICVLHELNLALNYADHIILMNQGKIFSHGSPLEVMTLENIETVYDTKVQLINQSNHLYFFPLTHQK